MINYGIIKPVNIGMYALLPLGMRVLNKFINLVDKEMTNLGAEKILLPALTSTSLWKKTNRYNSNKVELFTVKDRHEKEYILSPVSKKHTIYINTFCLIKSLLKEKYAISLLSQLCSCIVYN